MKRVKRLLREYREARLLARPGAGTARAAATPGLHVLKLEGGERDALLYVPRSYSAERPAPFALMLHGAGGDAAGGLSLLRDLADEVGLILLAPASQQYTWDVIASEYGPDVALISDALEQLFSTFAVDRTRLAIGGFSDGASYALSLGMSNGDIFTHILAFSPGFTAPARTEGRPRVFISHGTQDRVLPVERCSRRIVPQLERAGYPTRYREFKGPHTVPLDIAREALEWFMVWPG